MKNRGAKDDAVLTRAIIVQVMESTGQHDAAAGCTVLDLARCLIILCSVLCWQGLLVQIAHVSRGKH